MGGTGFRAGSGPGGDGPGRHGARHAGVPKYLREWDLLASAGAEDHSKRYKPSFAAALPPNPGRM